MVVTAITPSRVFPLPGYDKPIVAHGSYTGGSDIFAPSGTKVVSVVSGTVEWLSTEKTAPNSGGNAIQIKGTDGLTYYYAHLLNAPTVKVGETVKAGQQIGQVGNTGNAKTTPSHLHIGVGHGISTGVGAPGGVGQNFNAVAMLNALRVDKRANDPNLTADTTVINPPDIKFEGITIPGFNPNKLPDIYKNLAEAVRADVDPWIWLAIVSKESEFNSNAVNPKSGACGYAQIYPCINLSPEENIKEGLKRLKNFLKLCNGDMNCALNKYSGGGGSSYITDVKNRANTIKTANPSLGTIDPNFDPGTNNNSDSDSDSHVDTDCPPIMLNLGPVTVPFPDVGCIIRTTVAKMVEQLKNWWKSWQEQHIPNWTFVLLGILLAGIGLVMVGMDTGMIQKAASAATPVGRVASMAKAAT